jgi:hypothetical protein
MECGRGQVYAVSSRAGASIRRVFNAVSIRQRPH